MTMLDGNAAAGALADVFGRDVSGALVRCGSCGSTGALAATVAVLGDGGVVVRCRDCDAVLLTVVRGDGRTWLSMRGISAIRMDDS